MTAELPVEIGVVQKAVETISSKDEAAGSLKCSNILRADF